MAAGARILPGSAMIKVRKLRFDVDDEVPFRFDPRNREASMMVNILLLLAPAFERYFIRAIRESMPRIRHEAAREEANRTLSPLHDPRRGSVPRWISDWFAAEEAGGEMTSVSL